MKANEAIRNSTTPISKAVEPQRKAAVNKAMEHAQGVVDRVHGELAKHDWDLNAVAPRPNWRNSSRDDPAKRKHDLYSMLTHHDGDRNLPSRRVRSAGDVGQHEPHYVTASHSYKSTSSGKTVTHNSGKKFVEDAEEQAHAGYDGFVAKLHDKVGEHTHAELTGNHVWGHSILHVTKVDGSKEKWKTQQIFKLSKLGKPHNQWPTRKIK